MSRDINIMLPKELRFEKHEHRAPTDESVRLLREMETAAREQVVTVHTFDNVLGGSVALVHDPMTYCCVVHVRFTLNGHLYKVDHRFSQHEVERLDLGGKRELADLLIKDVGNAIAESLRADLLGKIGRSL